MSAEKTLSWLKAMEHPEGGIRAWPGHKAYPEVTGYLIPTLLKYGEREYAERLADWLESIQNDGGSWNGLEGGPATFDTAAILQGLWASGHGTAATMAYDWLKSLETPEGTLPASPTDAVRVYTMRATAIMHNERGADWWTQHLHEFRHERSHYIAYALEGLWMMGYHDLVRDWLEKARCPMLWMWPGSGLVDYCATAQIGLLKAWAGMDHMPYLTYLRHVQRGDGSFPMSFTWTAKYYLDLEHAAADKDASVIANNRPLAQGER